MDNASNNKTCLQELATMLRARDVEFDDALDRRIMCFPHIMHICVTHIIRDFTDTALANITEAWIDAIADGAERQAYAEAVASDPVALGCTIVRVIRTSGQRHDEFIDTIKTGNAKNWFKGPTGEAVCVPELELLCDADTRWDSTYAMLNRLRALRPVSNIFCHKLVF